MAVTTIVFVILLAWIVSREPNERTEYKSTVTVNKPFIGMTAEAIDNSSSAANTSKHDSPYWYATIKRPEWWLVGIGIITCFVVGWQAWETRKSASAAKDAAIVAKESTEMLISKERARLRIIAGAPFFENGRIIGFTVYLENTGPTAAFLEEVGIILVKAGEEIVPDYGECVRVPFTGSIAANSRTQTEARIPAEPVTHLTEAVLRELQNKTAFIHCYGFAKYRDVFDRPRQVRFHLRWHMQFGSWELVGPAEENSDK